MMIDLKFGWLSSKQKQQAVDKFSDACVGDRYWYFLDDIGNVSHRGVISQTKCNYPDCSCPFDAPADKDWCARGYSHEVQQ